jgi:hypothetical protein
MDINRPDRCATDAVDGWLQAGVNEFASELDARESQRREALSILRSMETTAVRQTNKLLRQTLTHPPLDWDIFRNSPLAVGNEHVAIRACTPQDFRQFAEEEQARADADYAVRLETCAAACSLADYMDAHGMRSGRDLSW